MKKNELDMLDLINKVQMQIIALDKKVDILISRASSQVRPPLPTPPVDRSNGPNKERFMHTAICADCKKECKIPFKPSGDRPVYCQDCFSRRKVISMSGMKNPSIQTPVLKEIDTPKPQGKKKAVAAKKTVSKKKPALKKKR